MREPPFEEAPVDSPGSIAPAVTVITLLGAVALTISSISLDYFVDEGFRPVIDSIDNWRVVLAGTAVVFGVWGAWGARRRRRVLLAVGALLGLALALV